MSRKLAGVPGIGMELSGRVLNSVRLSSSMVVAGLDRFVCSSPSGRMEYELAVTSTVDALSRQNSLKSGDLEEKEVQCSQSTKFIVALRLVPTKALAMVPSILSIFRPV